MDTIYSVVILIALLILAVWLFLKIRKVNGGGKKKTPKSNDSKKSKEEEEEEEKKKLQVNTNMIKVMIFRSLSDGLVGQAGKPLMCTEQKDSNNNLIVINEEAKFKEDFNFSQDRLYEIMNFSLKMQNKTKKEKAVIISKQIRKQQELVNSIDEDVELNIKYNYHDEDLKLKQLNVLRDSLKRETTGNYMRLGEGGIRQYEFVSIDGVLYPYFFGSKWFRVYPDLTGKKKIFNHENTVFRNETAALFKNALNWITIIALAIGLIMMAIGGFMMAHAYSKNSEVTVAANQGAITCANTLSDITDKYGDGVKEYLDYKKSITNEKDIKDKKDINNIDGIGSIIINPKDITR